MDEKYYSLVTKKWRSESIEIGGNTVHLEVEQKITSWLLQYDYAFIEHFCPPIDTEISFCGINCKLNKITEEELEVNCEPQPFDHKQNPMLKNVPNIFLPRGYKIEPIDMYLCFEKEDKTTSGKYIEQFMKYSHKYTWSYNHVNLAIR